MTIEELYEWAVKNNCADYDLMVRDYCGSSTYYIEPTIIENKTVEL